MNELKDLLNNKAATVVIVIVICMFALFIGGNILVDKVSDKVIEKLQSDYTPGPYTPGFDPDKVNPNIWNPSR